MMDMSDRIVKEPLADFYIVSNDGDFDNYIKEKEIEYECIKIIILLRI